MSRTVHSAAGQALGYQFQLQRALIEILKQEDAAAAVAIEALDDIVIEGEEGAVVSLEQLKHSIKAGTLTDKSARLWDVLALWMDLLAKDKIPKGATMILVATDMAPEGSAAHALRLSGRDTTKAQDLLLAAADESDNDSTEAARTSFKALTPAMRTGFLERIVVRDATPTAGEFRSALRGALRGGLPSAGEEAFLDQVIGRWDEIATDVLLGRRRVVSQDELLQEIYSIRDGFGPAALPAPDVEAIIDEAVSRGYDNAAFVLQLKLVARRAVRVELAIQHYHRAFAQRSRWMRDGVVTGHELRVWEDRLVDEWRDAFEAMVDEIENEQDPELVEKAGLALYTARMQSTANPLRGSPDWFLMKGTLHGLADVRGVGWHRDFVALLQDKLGDADADAALDEAYRKATHTEPANQ
jgi:hypothetical protein